MSDYYGLLNESFINTIAESHPVDPDNGNKAVYQQHMGTSDVLGILIALKEQGYHVVKKSRFIPMFLWKPYKGKLNA